MIKVCSVASLLALAAVSAAPTASETANVDASQTGAPQTEASQQVVRETELDRQVSEVAAQLRCVVCQGLSIQDSPSDLAQEMRAVVREQLAAGRSPDQVKAYFVDRYGEWVLLRPTASGFNLVVYLLPVLAILGGGVFVFFKARSWTRSARTTP